MTLQSSRLKRTRIKYTIAFFVLLIIEVLIALFVHDTLIRPYIGDLLVVVVLYMGIRILTPDRFRFLPLYIFLFAVLVELFQLFNLIQFLKVENNAFLRVLIGSVFDVKDILCYGIGCILLGVFEWKIKRKVKL